MIAGDVRTRKRAGPNRTTRRPPTHTCLVCIVIFILLRVASVDEGRKFFGKVKFPDSRDTPSNDDPHVCPRLTSPASPSSACPPAQVRVAKLFAKHMDADAQVKSLGPGQSPPVAVGTPARLRLLAERGALRLGRTEIFVVDNFRDGRGLTIVSDREASVDLAKFMQETVLPEMKKRETIKIGVF